jgi:A/G-specific adenine glycosylase
MHVQLAEWRIAIEHFRWRLVVEATFELLRRAVADRVAARLARELADAFWADHEAMVAELASLPEALAEASPAAVIREWQGLGYNRRGLNLHRAARQIAAEGWPADLTELPGVGPYTAAAVGNFALGREVLPVDTNVSRIQERTGHRFSAAAGQALMDLGATVCLARIPRCGICPLASECPSRGRRYEPQRKQSPFEGSFRQRRAQTLRLVAEARRPLGDLDPKAVESLARDGLVQVEPCGKFVTLP